MKRVHRYQPSVPQAVGDKGTEIVERHFQAYGVRRASDLPEEGRVHLMREMQQYLAHELPNQGGEAVRPSALGRWLERVKGWFNGE